MAESDAAIGDDTKLPTIPMIKTKNWRSVCRIVVHPVARALCAGSLAVAMPAVGQNLEPPSTGDAAFEHCRAIRDDAAKLRCFEEATSPAPARRPGDQGDVAAGWRLVRTPNPAGGPDAVAITRTADPSQSDLGFAGLMLRCGDVGGDLGIEVLLVMVQPFPPRAHPHVTVVAGAATAEFTTSTVPPGALLLLPPEAIALAMGPWLTAPELTVTVADDKQTTHGAVQLAGLGSALQELRANCATR